MIQRFGVAEERVHAIPHGASRPLSGPASTRADPVVLFVGSIFNRRRVPDLIRAFGRVARAHPDASLEIVGDNRSHPHQDLPAIIAAEEESWIDNELPDSTNPYLSVPRLRTLPVALQRRAILKWLRAQNISEVGFDVVERVRLLADREAPLAKVNLPKDRHVRRRSGKIFVE